MTIHEPGTTTITAPGVTAVPVVHENHLCVTTRDMALMADDLTAVYLTTAQLAALGVPTDGRVLLEVGTTRGTVDRDYALRVDDDAAATIMSRTSATRAVAPRDLERRAWSRTVNRAVAVLRTTERTRFDPRDGSVLTWNDTGSRAVNGAGADYFPRINPAVIGLIELAGTDRVLLARDARRDFFSLVAGYVEPGESLEHAFAREVAEETGRTCRDIRYAGSQPWPISDSVMIGFTAVTDDADARWGTDGELAEIIWAGPADILDGVVPIAPPGSIAHRLILGWARARATAATTNTEH
ncbi:NUDIX domain-containing protein [Corynebacterium sp. CCM 9185]|uniref:NAD(+) diphosphatase n=1 Tax=Corynebacterium marambiense TaxID=2765364 RepID=A0ABS0VXX1_9CORY|nr:NUDIX domain-containing protein [Corynebacterium marambiense]MCK7662092.1 NUDIX domain-containing protein [Corynebacterium marambiense]